MTIAIRALAFAFCLLFAFASVSRASEAMWESYHAAGRKAEDAGRFTEACKLYASALKEAEEFGESDRRLLTTIKDYADASDSDGKYEQSEALYKRLLSIFERNPKAERLNIALILQSLATVYMHEGKYTESEALQRRVLDTYTKESGPNSRDVASALDAMGRLYADQGRFAEAAPLYERALTILEKLLQQEKDESQKQRLLSNTTRSLRNAADAYNLLGRFDEALAALKKCLAIEQKISKPDDPMIAYTLSSMAVTSRRTGHYDEAEKLYKAAMAIYENSYGPDHVDTAMVANGLAATFLAQNKFDEAERSFKRAQSIYEKALGTEHPNLASIWRNMGSFYFEKRDYAQAESFYLRALSLREKVFGPNDDLTLAVVNDLASLYKVMKKNVEAKQLFDRLLIADEAKYGAKSPKVASDLKNLAQISAALAKNADADAMKRRANEIEQTLPGAGRLGALSAMSGTVSSTENTPVKDKWALVIGISKFKDPSINLRYAAKDAIDFKSYLVSTAGFKPDHVKLLTNEQATRDNIIGQLGDRFLGRLANKDDLVVIYVSSHGSTAKKNQGVNFLVASDTNKNALLGTGIPMQWLSDMIKEQVHADRVVMLLDVCHSGAASADGDKGLTRESNFDVEKVKLGTGQAVICSSLSDQLSWESKRYDNSVFTRKLIESLKKRGNETSLTEAYSHLRNEVESEVLRDRSELQTPVLNMKSWTGADPVLSVTPTSPRPGMESSIP